MSAASPVSSDANRDIHILTLAPMALFPPRTGDSRRIHRVAKTFHDMGVDNLLVGKDFLYRSDEDVRQSPRKDKSRRGTGIEAFLKRAHYNEVKHCTPQWAAFAKESMQDPRYNVVYCQFLWTVPMVEPYLNGRPLLVDTHNSEWQWYDRFAESTRSPLVRAICKYSNRRVDELMAALPKNTAMVHVTRSDMADYEKVRPDLTHLLLPNGADLHPRANMPDYAPGVKRRLLLFGSLGGKMALDSLTHFAEKYWPALKDVTEFIVAGAHPAEKIVEMCKAEGWTLIKDLSEEQVTELYESVHFVVLPFAYGVGVKLKLIDACARGIPTVSTVPGTVGLDWYPDFIQVSEEPEGWRRIVQTENALPPNWREEVAEFGERYGWPKTCNGLLDGMRTLLAQTATAK